MLKQYFLTKTSLKKTKRNMHKIKTFSDGASMYDNSLNSGSVAATMDDEPVVIRH